MTNRNLWAVLFCLVGSPVFSQPIELVKNIHPSEEGADLYGAFEYNGKLVFGANDAVHGIEYWISDGTASGTQLFKDINPGGSSLPLFMGIHNGLLLFRADDGSHGIEPWISDGTEGGTQLLSDCNKEGDGLPPFFQPGISFQDDLYFVAAGGAPNLETQLWKRDGTTEETVLVSDQLNESCLAIPGPHVMGDQLYFFNYTIEGALQLHATDGASNSLIYDWGILSDINVQVQSYSDDRMFILLNDGVHGRELWLSDGTPSGTHLLKDIHPNGDGVVLGKSMPFPLNDQWLFLADDGIHGMELWVTDGTENGTHLLKDIGAQEDLDLESKWLHEGWLIFPADDGIHGKEWWVTDGTEAGTQLLLDLHPGGDGLDQYISMLDRDSFFYFAGGNDATGIELWKSDGTPSGTQLVKDIRPGPESSEPVLHLSEFPAFDEVYFIAEDGVHGREVWVTDGTEPGTQLLHDLHLAGSSDPVFLARVNNTLYLEADDGIFGRELYKIELEVANPESSRRHLLFPNPTQGEPWLDFPEGLEIKVTDGKHLYHFSYQTGPASDVYWLDLERYAWWQENGWLFGWRVKF